MKPKEIASRITGFSVPILGGLSWNPPESEIAVARRVLAFLEDRRVLYDPYHLEVEAHCIRSVLEIRRFLTTEIGALVEGSKLAGHLRGMRAACRKFLQDLGPRRRLTMPSWRGPFESTFFLSLGELRAAVGLHVAAIALMYGLDVEGQLAEVLPQIDEDEAADASEQGV